MWVFIPCVYLSLTIMAKRTLTEDSFINLEEDISSDISSLHLLEWDNNYDHLELCK